MVEHLPLSGMPALRGLVDYYYDWLAHPTWDDYWKGFSPRGAFQQGGGPGTEYRRLVRRFPAGNRALL